MTKKKLIIGLGNPGQEYEYTRHNLGFLIAKRLADKLSIKFSLSSFTNGLTAIGKHNGEDILILLPLTYMNNSGAAVKSAVKNCSVDVSDMLVVCDDLSLPFGQIRIRGKGTDGGHNGLKSIIEKLETKDFARLRVGIDRPKSADQTVDYVLEEFSKTEKQALPDIIEKSYACCETWLTEGFKKAMEMYNRPN